MSELKKTLMGVKERVANDSLGLVAAGVAFYVFLSVFPALASAISIYGLIADPQTIQSHIGTVSGLVPEEVLGILSERMQALADQEGSLTFGLVIGILVSLWSANKAMKAVAQALDIAYDTKEERGVVKFNAVTLALTLLSIIAFILVVSVVVVVPIVVSVFLSQQTAELLVSLVSWAAFLLLLVGMSLVLYNFAPDRRRRSWKELLPGAILTAVLFVIASAAFAFYVTQFGQFNEEYGALGGVVVLMLWLYLGAFVFLLGAEYNAERVRHFVDQPKEERYRGGAPAAA